MMMMSFELIYSSLTFIGEVYDSIQRESNCWIIQNCASTQQPQLSLHWNSKHQTLTQFSKNTKRRLAHTPVSSSHTQLSKVKKRLPVSTQSTIKSSDKQTLTTFQFFLIFS
jgi:hypothetical protein